MLAKRSPVQVLVFYLFILDKKLTFCKKLVDIYDPKKRIYENGNVPFLDVVKIKVKQNPELSTYIIVTG